MKVNHINIPDDKANIFCKRINSIIHLDKGGKFWRTCRKCPMFNGTYQGEGVECMWDDNATKDVVSYVIYPEMELRKLGKA